MQSFRYVPHDSLPALAWCARIRRGSGVATVFHGMEVETSPGFFAEAAWNGGLDAAGLRTASVVCGTGGMIDASGLVFRAGTDGLCPLFSVRHRDVLHVSNSPVFALTAAGEKPDPLYPFYSHGLLRIFRRGVHGSRESLPTASPGVKLGVHFYVVVRIGPDLAMELEAPPAGDEPTDWRHYERLLEQAVRGVFANARDPARHKAYVPIAQVSRGYDSTASAALAAAAGCVEAVTIRDSRAVDPARDDGTATATRLGMCCRSFDRWDYRQRPEASDAECAFATVTTAPAWLAIDGVFAGRLVVAGTHGDCTWDVSGGKTPSNDLERPAATAVVGVSGLEFRLRVGFLQLNPPTIGMRHARKVAAIGRSAEMRPWSIGGSYDRPVPRRIAEDRGVPRSTFGMTKIAGGHSHFYRAETFSPAALRDYDAFRTRSLAAAPALKRAVARLRCAAEQAAWLCLHEGRRRSAVAMLLPWQPVVVTGGRHSIPWRFRFVFQWVCDTLTPRYRLPEHEEDRTT